MTAKPGVPDDARWRIIHADPSRTNREISQETGVHARTVARIRRDPWCIPVEYVPCKRCGETITRSTSTRHGHRWKYHAACYVEQRAEWNREAQRRRFNALPPEAQRRERQRLADVGAERAAERYQATREAAANHRQSWTAEDDAWLMTHYRHRDIVTIATQLGRTTNAVRRRYDKIAK